MASLLKRFLNHRAGGSIETNQFQRGQITGLGYAFGYHRQSDTVGNGGEALQKGLVARVAIEPANKAAVHFQIVQSQAMKLADFTELPPEVLQAHLAAYGPKVCTQADKSLEMRQSPSLRNLQPQA